MTKALNPWHLKKRRIRAKRGKEKRTTTKKDLSRNKRF
jgi:hypothetical protein